MMRLILALSLVLLPVSAFAAKLETAVFASGCFWCTQTDFDHVKGVTATTVGYLGGKTNNPTYKTYVAGGHREAVLVEYDADVIPFQKLVDTFWRTFDVTDAGGQFCDRGQAYTSAIYIDDAARQKAALASKTEAEKALGQPIVTPILPLAPFWPAETYHQKYAEKNPVRYSYYRYRCGRNARVEQIWGKDAYWNVEKH
jgi:peptide-methionine (S)-S-oxide reductase